ncbi:MAG TPA: primase-like DNA-binding domain-containing protein, partial [Acidimicrobiia bacterium]|nr:primase-like DNA-binding domain-containing protein [Acidimicrobiia bacterium]
QAGLELSTQLEELSSPVLEFIRDRCCIGAEFQISRADLFDAWRSWCVKNGVAAGTSATFGRDLKAAQPHVTSARPRTGDGDRTWMHRGIGLRAAE